MAGSKRKRLPLHSNSIRLFGKELHMYPNPSSPTDTTATSMEVVGDQPIPTLSAVSGLEDNNDPPKSPIPDPPRSPKYNIPPWSFRLFGKLHPKPQRCAPPPTDTTATSIGLVASQRIPATSAVNGPQDINNPPQPPGMNATGRRVRPRRNGMVLNPNTPCRRVRPRRNGTALDPESVGVSFYKKKGLWESNLWYPGVRIPGSSRDGLQIFLGSYLTEQEAQDVHDRAALKLLQTEGVVSGLNFIESRHTEFMEEYKDWNFRDFVWQFRRYSVGFTKGKSSMKGVAVIETAKGNWYEAKTTRMHSQKVGKVHYCFGKFESEEEAGRAYDRGLLFLHHEETDEQKLNVITNFRPSGYSESEILRAGQESQQYKVSDPSRIA